MKIKISGFIFLLLLSYGFGQANEVDASPLPGWHPVDYPGESLYIGRWLAFTDTLEAPMAKPVGRARRNAGIIEAEYSGLAGFSKRPSFAVTIDKGTAGRYRRGFPYNVFEPVHNESGEAGETVARRKQRVGVLRLEHAEANSSGGRLTLASSRVARPKDYGFTDYEVVFYRFRRFSFSPFVFSLDYDDVFSLEDLLDDDYSAIGYVALGSISYRFSSLMAVGTRVRVHGISLDTNAAFVDIYGSFLYRANSFFEPFVNIGLAVNTLTKSESWEHSDFFVEPGARFYLANWLSLDLIIPLRPEHFILPGMSFHLF